MKKGMCWRRPVVMNPKEFSLLPHRCVCASMCVYVLSLSAWTNKMRCVLLWAAEAGGLGGWGGFGLSLISVCCKFCTIPTWPEAPREDRRKNSWNYSSRTEGIWRNYTSVMQGSHWMWIVNINVSRLYTKMKMHKSRSIFHRVVTNDAQCQKCNLSGKFTLGENASNK